jgi:hypothetical protein
MFLSNTVGRAGLCDKPKKGESRGPPEQEVFFYKMVTGISAIQALVPGGQGSKV